MAQIYFIPKCPPQFDTANVPACKEDTYYELGYAGKDHLLRIDRVLFYLSLRVPSCFLG